MQANEEELFVHCHDILSQAQVNTHSISSKWEILRLILSSRLSKQAESGRDTIVYETLWEMLEDWQNSQTAVSTSSKRKGKDKDVKIKEIVEISL